MKKHTLKIVIGLLISMAIIIVVLAKPARIAYHLRAYRHAVKPLRLDASGSDAALIKQGIAGHSRSLLALYELGYLSDFTIPIERPRSDAEDILAMISASFFTYGIPATAVIERTATNTVLSVVDKPENQLWWKRIAAMYLETKDDEPAR